MNFIKNNNAMFSFLCGVLCYNWSFILLLLLYLCFYYFSCYYTYVYMYMFIFLFLLILCIINILYVHFNCVSLLLLVALLGLIIFKASRLVHYSSSYIVDV